MKSGSSSKRSVGFDKGARWHHEVDDDSTPPEQDYFKTEPENINEMLRHEAYRKPQMKIIQYNKLTPQMSAACTVVLQEALQKIVTIREMHNMPFKDADLQYVPMRERYTTPSCEVETLLNQDPAFLAFRKFKRDLAWVEKMLSVAILNFLKDNGFDDIYTILDDHEKTKEAEGTLLKSKNFNQSELVRLRIYRDAEREQMVADIQKVTEELGNLKDELNDRIVETAVKIKFVKQWEASRHEQNKLILSAKERSFIRTAKEMKLETNREARVHEEILQFLAESIEEHQKDIEKWMERYDTELEEQEKQIQEIKIKITEQTEAHIDLIEQYKARQQAIEDYKEHKRQRREEEEELELRTAACTKIQSWWRGVMFRKGLGPFRRKKGKGKKAAK